MFVAFPINNRSVAMLSDLCCPRRLVSLILIGAPSLACAQSAGDYQGWLFGTGGFEDISSIEEEYCFGTMASPRSRATGRRPGNAMTLI